MRTDRVLFIGGRSGASVEVRARQVALALGCDFLLLDNNQGFRKGSLLRYGAFVLVKPKPWTVDFLPRGAISVYDVIDRPPSFETSLCLFSTHHAMSYLNMDGVVIPHHHLNTNRTPSRPSTSFSWIGHKEWLPDLPVQVQAHRIEGMRPDDIRKLYEATGIGVNFRRHDGPNYEKHVQMNSGIKLINCLGYGIPSISEIEPAYLEISEDSTFYTSDIHEGVSRLYWDEGLRETLRARAAKLSESYHLSNIVKQYKILLEAL